MRKQNTLSKLATTIVLAGGLIMTLPFFWLISSSLKAPSKIYVFPPQFIPDPIRWQNYVEVFNAVPVFLYARNTFIITFLPPLERC